jgi:RNA polymerase sigma factor (TIGR02999 family)
VSSPPDTTQLLLDAGTGNQLAIDALWPRVYDELRSLAHERLRHYRPGDTLDTTALVHEAYLRLVDGSRVDWRDRAHFFALAARAMRFVLVDYARTRTAQKRGGALVDLRLDRVVAPTEDTASERAADLLTLNGALDQLAQADDRLSRLVEYRFFGGLTYDEIAEVTGHSVPTVKRDWRRARTWLYQSMQDSHRPPATSAQASPAG